MTNIKHLDKINAAHDFAVETEEKIIDVIFDTTKDCAKFAAYVYYILPAYAVALTVDAVGTKIDDIIHKTFTKEEIAETSRRMI